jgi:hypothetical protein
MSELDNVNKMFENEYKQCDECYEDVNIMKMIVKGTPDGQCIYCPKCVQRHKFLEMEEKRLAKLWGIDLVKYGKQVEQHERRIAKEAAKKAAKEQK